MMTLLPKFVSHCAVCQYLGANQMNDAALKQKLLVASVLVFLGFAGNYLALPLAYGMAFIFGSIFSIVAISMLGPWWGVGVALAASSYTIILWNHPYALIIFAFEALWVGFALRRGRTNLVLIDALFWLVCGWLLVALFYGGFMHLGLQGAGIIILKQMLNGVFNALVAAILLDHTPLRRLVGLEVQQTTYKRLIFHVICMIW
jgi:predicted membrane protein